MYYYIFDIRKCTKRSQVEEIKNQLAGFGITGEFTYPSAAQNAKDLVDVALAKQYNTIVAIGGDDLINTVAGRLVGRKEAFGVIPLDASTELHQLIGAPTWKEAAEILRYRKISEMFLGQTATNNTFLTSVNLDIHAPTDITLEFKDFILHSTAKMLKITNYNPNIKKIGPDYLDITIESATPEESKLSSKLAAFFGAKKETDDLAHSLLHARSLRIFTKTPINLVSGGSVIARTPQLIESTDLPLRLITAKNSTNL